MPREIQHVPFKGMGVAAPLIGEGHLGLASLAAGQAPEPLDGQLDPDRLAADRQRTEAAGHLPGLHHFAGPAVGAAEGVGVLFDDEADHAFLENDCGLLIAAHTPAVIQQTCGHELVSFLKLGNSRRDSHVHAFSTTTYASAGRT